MFPFVQLLVISVSLALDSFSVSIAGGLKSKVAKISQAFKVAAFFGIFQAFMPIIGWGLGTSVQSYMEAYAHWIAFVMLALVGSNMLKEAVMADEE